MLETIQSAVEMAVTARSNDMRKKNTVIAINLSIGKPLEWAHLRDFLWKII